MHIKITLQPDTAEKLKKDLIITTDDHEYYDLETINHEKRDQILAYLAEHQPGKLKAIQQDPFVQLLKKDLGAHVLLRKAKNVPSS